MTHLEGETRVKALQRSFLCWVEAHPDLEALDMNTFNVLRKSAFRATFGAFKLGRVGVTTEESDGVQLWHRFFDWASLPGVPEEVRLSLMAKCFVTTLEAFRIGALVTGAES